VIIMSVRKRVWTTRAGECREAFIADYVDQHGERHIKTFKLKREAEEYAAQVGVDVKAGMHTPESKSPTIKQAAENWLKMVELRGRERGTLAQYRQHVDLHIAPRLGKLKLAKLTAKRVHEFVEDLLIAEVSQPLTRKVLTSLKSILTHAHKRGDVAQNVAANVKLEANKRDKAQLRAGVDFPTVEEVQRVLAASSKWRPLLVVAVFTGLRASELRGLRWEDIDLKKGELHVHQRADAYREIGQPKSVAGQRTIPVGPMVVNTLKAWKLQCPKGEAGLVFPDRHGHVQHHKQIERAIAPVFAAAGVKPYGLHALRHFYASWCINRRADGGLELPGKLVQARLGHSSITITMDRYGHLFPRGDDGAELAAAERALFAG
jgi:integrase